MTQIHVRVVSFFPVSINASAVLIRFIAPRMMLYHLFTFVGIQRVLKKWRRHLTKAVWLDGHCAMGTAQLQNSDEKEDNPIGFWSLQ
jgi:hypothetical protein